MPLNTFEILKTIKKKVLQIIFWLISFFLPNSFVVNRFTISVPSTDLAGLKIIQLTDIHYNGEFYPRAISDRLLSRIISFVDEERPDILVFTGDYVDKDPSPISGLCEKLSKLQIFQDKSKQRVFGVLGNHDSTFSNGRQLVTSSLSKIGVRVLENEVALFQKEGNDDDSLAIVGFGDLWAGNFNPSKGFTELRALESDSKTQKIKGVIVLSHNPDTVASMLDEKVDLILCGHTHGGQICDPIWKRPVLEHLDKNLPTKLRWLVPKGYLRNVKNWKWSKGLFKLPSQSLGVPSKTLFTCSGLASHFSLRFFCPPEVAVITLVSA